MRLLVLFYRELARLWVLFELAAIRAARLIRPPEYQLTGACQTRGTCCTMIVGDPPQFVKQRPRLLALFAAYHRLMHNFHVVARGANDELIFRCGYLQDDGRCGIYRYRPLICRNYPIVPLFEPPRPIPGCGFGVVARRVARMKRRASLHILNPFVAVHHPTRPGGREQPEALEHYELVDLSES